MLMIKNDQFWGFPSDVMPVISFIREATDTYIPSKTSRTASSIPWITPRIRRINSNKKTELMRKQRKLAIEV